MTMHDRSAGLYMTVKEMGALLGLKKVDSYWLVKKGYFRIITAAGKMWIDRNSFEQWYSNQDHYHKIDSLTREDVITDYYSIRDIMDLLEIGESTAYRVIAKGCIPVVRLFGSKRILKKDFWTWYGHQDLYHIPKNKLPDPPDGSAWLGVKEISRLLGITEAEMNSSMMTTTKVVEATPSLANTIFDWIFDHYAIAPLLILAVVAAFFWIVKKIHRLTL